MVADLVGEHVRLREVARRAEARAQIAVERRDRCTPSRRRGSRTGPSRSGRCRTRNASRRGTARGARCDSRATAAARCSAGRRARTRRTGPAPPPRGSPANGRRERRVGAPDRCRRSYPGRRSSSTVGSTPSSHITATSATAPPRLMRPRPAAAAASAARACLAAPILEILAAPASLPSHRREFRARDQRRSASRISVSSTSSLRRRGGRRRLLLASAVFIAFTSRKIANATIAKSITTLMNAP